MHRADKSSVYRLSPPGSCYVPLSIRSSLFRPALATAANSASGSITSGQALFAKVNNLTQPRIRDASNTHEDPPPNDLVKAPMFTNVVPKIKEASIGSLQGMDGDIGTSHIMQFSSSKLSNKSSRVSKDAIEKPRPLLPSLGTYLTKDRTGQIVCASATQGIISRQPGNDSGSSFVGRTITIGNMKRGSFVADHSLSLFPPLSASSQTFDSAPRGCGVHIVKAEPKNLIYQCHSGSAIAQIPSQSGSHRLSSFGTPTYPESIVSTLTDKTSYPLTISDLQPQEVARRRQDFTRPRTRFINGEAVQYTLVSPTVPSDLQHARMMSEDSADSVAVIETATLAVRSPMAGVLQVSSSQPYILPFSLHNHSAHTSLYSDANTTAEARLVQFAHKKYYHGSFLSDKGKEHVSGAHPIYPGRREISRKTVIGGSSGTPHGQRADMNDVAPAHVLATTLRESVSNLKKKAKMLREQLGSFYERRQFEATELSHMQSVLPAEGFLDDPTTSAGIRYTQTLGSQERVVDGKKEEPLDIMDEDSAYAAFGVELEEEISMGSATGKVVPLARYA